MFLACSVGINASPVEEAYAESVQENGGERSPISFECNAKFAS